MAIIELFSKRRNDALKSDQEDVFTYSEIPDRLRIQFSQIALEAIGIPGSYGDRIMTADVDNQFWSEIETIYLREKGVRGIGNGRLAGERIIGFMDKCLTDDWLDLCELICRLIGIVKSPNYAHQRQRWEARGEPDQHLEEINYRFLQAGVGYQVEEGSLIRVDSQFIHVEIVKPALALMRSNGFIGPIDEFLQAYAAHRDGNDRHSLVMAASAVESTLKTIFDQKGWPYQKSARISDLLKVARANQLWPDYLDGSFDQLVATLHSGLPKIRDNDGAHGQGSEVKSVPSYIAGYALHLAASKIVFLIKAASHAR